MCALFALTCTGCGTYGIDPLGMSVLVLVAFANSSRLRGKPLLPSSSSMRYSPRPSVSLTSTETNVAFFFPARCSRRETLGKGSALREANPQPASRGAGWFHARGGRHFDRYVAPLSNLFAFTLNGSLPGATNFPESLDKALLRPGRFDRHIVVPLPDVRGRMQILQHHMASIGYDKNNVDISMIARGTIGFSGADLQALVNQAAVKASADNAKAVRASHFEWAKERVRLSLTFSLVVGIGGRG